MITRLWSIPVLSGDFNLSACFGCIYTNTLKRKWNFKSQAAADLAVEEAELQRHVEQEKEREKELLKSHSKDKRNKKEGGRRSKTKSGKRSPGKNPVPESPVPGNT